MAWFAGAVVLRNEDARVGNGRLKEAEEDPREHGGGEAGFEREEGIFREEEAVDRLHDGVVDHAECERPGEAPDGPVGFEAREGHGVEAFRWQAARTAWVQSGPAAGQRGWKAQPVGQAQGGGTTPGMSFRGASLGAAREGTAASKPRV